MIRIENTEVSGWEAAVRGLRNPMNSWEKSDSEWDWVEDESIINPNDPGMTFLVGENDFSLMKKLAESGSDHRKFMRMIIVTCDITAPLYWFKEYDTYKVGTVANSCSTMHKIHAKEFTLDDFSHEHLISSAGKHGGTLDLLEKVIAELNYWRNRYIETNRKECWWQMIQLLPSSYNQRRTVLLNYEVLRNIYHARKSHKLDEWRAFCEWIKTLPYAELICCPIKETI